MNHFWGCREKHQSAFLTQTKSTPPHRCPSRNRKERRKNETAFEIVCFCCRRVSLLGCTRTSVAGRVPPSRANRKIHRQEIEEKKLYLYISDRKVRKDTTRHFRENFGVKQQVTIAESCIEKRGWFITKFLCSVQLMHAILVEETKIHVGDISLNPLLKWHKKYMYTKLSCYRMQNK